MPKVAKLQRRLLTDEEVRFIAEKFEQVMGGPMSGRWAGRMLAGSINLIDRPAELRQATWPATNRLCG
jgi:hypothetical protein